MNTAPTTVSFSPGSGFGIVAWPTVALIESADLAVAERLWDGLVAGGDGNDLIDELSADGFRNLGSFVVGQIEGADIRLFVRGRATVRYTAADDAGEIDGSSVRTWIERVVTGFRSVDLAIDGTVGVDGPFSVTSGLVPADRLSWSTTAGRPGRTASTDRYRAIDGRSTADPVPATPQVPPGQGSATALDVVDAGHTLHYDSGEGETGSEAVAEGGAVASPATPAVSDAVSDGDPQEYDYDALFGHTTHRSVQDAAVAVPDESELDDAGAAAPDLAEPQREFDPPPVSTPSPPGLISAIPAQPVDGARAESPDAEDPGDHDGLTMTVAQLRALRATHDSQEAVPSSAFGGGPTVQALICAEGHPNPTVLDSCRRCGRPLAPAPVVIARPSLGRVVLSSGQTIELTRSAIVGRNPRVEGTMHGEVPSTLKIEGNQALSRSHAIIRLEGWQVMVEDLDSANGTTVTLQGRPPRRLRAGEPVILEHGALIDFGGEVTGTYDALA